MNGQPVPFFLCAYALAGPILRFVPSDILNPQMECVGDPKTGKSSVGIYAASVWAGNPERSEGGGENWNMTPASYDILRRSHKDMFMLLDEAEGTDATASKRSELAKVVIFGGASGGSRRRYTDTKSIPPMKMPMLSTANTSIRKVLEKEPPERVEAVASRMMSLRITASDEDEGGIPIFAFVPPGFNTKGDAMRAMRHVADRYYGTAGPAFAECIALAIREDEAAFRAELDAFIENARIRLSMYAPSSDQRHVAFMAVIEVTAILAQKFGILQPKWGQPAQVVEKMLLSLQSDNSERIRRVAEMKALFIRYVSRRTKKGKLRRFHPAILPWRFEWMDAKKLPQFMGLYTVDANKRRKELFLHPAYFRKTFRFH